VDGGGRADRLERAVMTVILLGVGAASMAVAWVHVKDWTVHHTPPGTGTWVGWVNAAVSELVPIAAGLVIRRRRHAGESLGMALFVLATFGAFSLAAQVAEAPASPSGWLLAAVPSLGALAVVKLVLSLPVTAPAARADTAADSRPVTRPDTGAVTGAVTSGPASVRGPDTRPDRRPDTATRTTGTRSAPTRTARRTPARTGRPDTGAAVAGLRDRHPELSTTEIAERVGVSDRTVRRHLTARTTPNPAHLSAVRPHVPEVVAR
jgi:hypothetical protein